jgi:hypothetical protein
MQQEEMTLNLFYQPKPETEGNTQYGVDGNNDDL